MSPGPIVFLVDDDAFELRLLGGILRQAGHRVEAFDHPDALLRRLGPGDRGCIVMDLRMPELDGLALHRALVERGNTPTVVFVSGRARLPDAVTALKQGAMDFLEKPVDPAELLATVAAALKRDAEAAALRSARESARAAWASLSAREQEVSRLHAGGLLLKQIAGTLGLSESTVHMHRTRALHKLGTGSVADLVRLLEWVGEELTPRGR